VIKEHPCSTAIPREAVGRRVWFEGAGQAEWRPDVPNLRAGASAWSECTGVRAGRVHERRCYWPEPPATLAGFSDHIRRQSFSIYHELGPEYGIPTGWEAVCDEQHVMWPFALDLVEWAI
jgi:hypothetical protein